MGKDKNKKFKACRPKPTGLPSVQDFEAELENSQTVSNQTIQNLVEKLNSPSEEERECSCAGIAGLVTQPQAISKLLQHNVIKILGPLMLDHSIQVRHCALGALRNLSVDGGVDVCEEMIQRDLLTPLVALFKQYGIDWTPEKEASKKQKDYKTEIFVEAVHLLWNLCETSETAVEIFNKESLVMNLWPCLQYGIYGENVAITAAQCLHTVTEDNSHLSTVCKQPDMLSVVQGLISDTSESTGLILLRTLATGILVNVSGGQLTSASGDLVTQVVASISKVFDVDAQEVFRSAVSSQEASSVQKCMEQEYGVQEPEDLSDAENILAAQQVALEIVANLCCNEDDWEDLDSSESSSDDMMVDTPMEEAENGLFSPLCIPTEVQGTITNSDIFNKVVQKVQQIKTEGIEMTEKRKTVCNSFERLQIHALLCVNNLVSSMDIQALGGLDNLQKVWVGLGMLSMTQQAKENSDVLEAVTSAMRAVVVKLVECESPELSKVELTDLQILFEMGQQCQQKNVRVNAVRIVATIGCLLAKQQTPHPFMQNIGLFLLEVCCKDVELWVVAEALDSIFDVFGEDHLNPVMAEIHLIERLQQLLPMLKGKIKSCRQSLGDHYPVISTARTNLARFIKYKISL